MLQGKKILVGVTGSIAAYKTILLVRLLVKAGAEVKLIMTPASKEFVSPLVLSTLSKHDVLTDLATQNNWANHVALGRWADVFLIAPLSCNTLAKMATGLCDNLLLAVYLSATCPVVVAPAMDEDMWHHPSTKKNIESIKSYGNTVITVNNGELASGLFGEGRMAEPEEIIDFLTDNYFRLDALTGKKILITAGPTYEAIDPVRFIGNHSSGKMGYALAKEFYLQGADVEVISGPTSEELRYKNIGLQKVQSSEEMFTAVKDKLSKADIVVMSAAVADYKPATVAENKIKKGNDEWDLPLVKTQDILHYAGHNKKVNQFIVGFALETENELANAQKKLQNKGADCIVLNSFNNNNKVFGSDFNAVSILHSSGEIISFEQQTKDSLAKHIVQFVINKTNTKNKA